MCRMFVVVLVLLLILPLVACNLNIGNTETGEHAPTNIETPEGARAQIARLHIPYTVDEFVNRARQCDVVAVELFLRAGMNPQARDANGTTALMAATEAGHTEIVQVLNQAGTKE